LEDLDIDGRKKLKWILVDWTFLAQGRDPWWALVNIVLNLQVP
jgi:hypothetical protein